MEKLRGSCMRDRDMWKRFGAEYQALHKYHSHRVRHWVCNNSRFLLGQPVLT